MVSPSLCYNYDKNPKRSNDFVVNVMQVSYRESCVHVRLLFENKRFECVLVIHAHDEFAGIRSIVLVFEHHELR